MFIVRNVYNKGWEGKLIMELGISSSAFSIQPSPLHYFNQVVWVIPIGEEKKAMAILSSGRSFD